MRTWGYARRRLVGVSIVCLLSVAPALAQSEALVRGQIVAAADGSALPQAVVTLASPATGASETAQVDVSGRFAFRSVRPGVYTLRVSADGFATRDVQLEVEPREITNATVALELRQLDVSVNVTAPRALPSAHSPSSTVLTQDRLATMPAFERVNLPNAIVATAPGMIRGHDDFVHVRGHEIALNPVINGVSFWENTHAVFSAGLSPDVIDSANIMTGAFPAEYGNRFGGVVDIVTKSGLGLDDTGAFTIDAGEAGRRRVAGEFGGHRGEVGYYAFGSMFASDRFSSPPDPEAFHDHARGGHAFLQLDANLGSGGLFRSVVIGDATDMQIPKTPRDQAMRPEANPRQRTRQQTAIAGWSRAWPAAAVAASFYQRWSDLHLSPAAGPLTARAELDRDLLTIGAKIDVTRLAGRHAIKAGLDIVRLRPKEDLAYSYEGYRELTHVLGLPHIHVSEPVIAFHGRDGGGQISAYVQDAVQLGSRTTVDAGLRIDRYDLLVSNTHVSPRVNVAFRVHGDAVLHASLNHFFVPPPIEGVLSSSAGLTRFIREIGIALPPIEPTVENQVEFGLTTPFRPVQIGVTGYYRGTDNPVHTTVWPDSRIYSYASFETARAYGMELKADAPGLARFGVTGYVNYALGRVEFRNPVTGGFVTEAGHITDTNRFLAPMDQTHTLTGGGTYRHARTGIWFGASVEYGSGTPIGHGGGDHEHGAGEADHEHAAPSSAAARVAAHFTGNVSTGFDVWRRADRGPKVSLQFDVANVANDVYVIAREGEFSPAQFSIPRLVSATLKVRF